MAFPIRLINDSSILLAAGFCLVYGAYKATTKIFTSVFFNPLQTVASNRTTQLKSILSNPKIGTVARRAGIGKSNRVHFGMQISVEKVKKAKKFIFSPLKSFEALTEFDRIDTAYRAARSDPRNGLVSDPEILAHFIYLWLHAVCGTDVLRHIPEIGSKSIVEAITYTQVPNFGSIFNDERVNFRDSKRHVLRIQNWFLHTPYKVEEKIYPSISKEFDQNKIDDPYEDKCLLKNLIFRRITAIYGNNLHLDVPQLRNHHYLYQVVFENFPDFPEIFLEQRNRFRTQSHDKFH